MGRFPLSLPVDGKDTVGVISPPDSHTSPTLSDEPSFVPVRGVFSPVPRTPPVCSGSGSCFNGSTLTLDAFVHTTLSALAQPFEPLPGLKESDPGGSGGGSVDVSEHGRSEGPRPFSAPVPPTPVPRTNPSNGTFSLSSSLTCVPTIITYNVRGLSYYAGPGESEDRKRRVRSAIEEMTRKADIVCLQETKLAPSERQALSNLGNCQVSYSNFSKSSAGTLIIDCPGVLRFFQGESIKLPDFTRGHVQLRRYTPRTHASTRSPFQLFNFYLFSGGNKFPENTEIIKSLLTLDASVPTFVCGDFNFIENKSDSTSNDPTLPSQEFLKTWGAFKTHFGVVDVEHDAHTFFHIDRTSHTPPGSGDVDTKHDTHIDPKEPFSPYTWSSRLDRFLAPVEVCSHPLFDPVVDIHHHPSNHTIKPSRSSFSDHLPVRLSFQDSSGRSSGRPTIPAWLAESPVFEETLRENWAPVASDGSFKTLAKFKRALFAAARAARRVKISAASTHLQLSQHLALLRLVVSTIQDKTRVEALELNPSLSSLVLFDGSRWTLTGLEEATRDLAAASHATSPSPEPQKLNVVKALAEKIPSSRAQISTLRNSPDDSPASTSADKSVLTKEYWGKVWAERPPLAAFGSQVRGGRGRSFFTVP